MIEACMTARSTDADNYIKEHKKKLEGHAKETSEMIKHFKFKAGPLLHKAANAAASTTGAPVAFIPVALGGIIHSNHVNSLMLMDAMAKAPTLTGINPEQAKAFAQFASDFMNEIALMVPSPAMPKTAVQAETATTEVGSQSLPQAQPGAILVPDGESSTAAQIGAATNGNQDPAHSSMDELTDGTDSDDELMNANSAEAPIKRKKKMTKAEKKARADSTANGGAASKIGKGKPEKKK